MKDKNEKYALALDVGTTSVKAAVFSSNGLCAGSSLCEYELIKPAPDFVELDPDTYWNASVTAIRNVLRECALESASIIAVGVTSQGESLTVLDVHGKPLRKTIVWLDNRSGDESEEIAEKFPLEHVYHVTGQQEIVPSWPATKILWLKKHEPQVFQRAAKFLMVADFIVYKLTGRYVSDRALNPSTLYFDIIKNEWWREMLEFLEITREQLPELVFSGEPAGTVVEEAAAATGLFGGTVVTTGPIDQVSGGIGAGNIEPGIISETTGAALAVCATVEKPVYDPEKRLGLYNHGEKGRYVLLPWVPTAGMVLRWFRDEFGAGAGYPELCALAAEVAPGCDGLVMLPFLSGAGSPEFNPSAKGVFWGIGLGHKKAHFIRAVMESICFMLRSNIEMLESMGCEVRDIRSLGGAARSELWIRMKADICGKSLTVMECEETTCMGAAMLAFVCAGVFPGLKEARERMVRERQTVHPDKSLADVYNPAYEKYKAVYAVNKPLFIR